MNRKITKILSLVMALMILVSMLTATSFGYTAFNSYNYNYYGEAIETPSGYTPVKRYTGADLGVGNIEKGIDLYVSPQNEIYVLDQGSENAVKLHIFDANFKHLQTISVLTDDGEEVFMNAPEGVTVDKEGYIYICDTGNQRLLKIDRSGEIVLRIEEPKSELFDKDFVFKPSKVAIAKNDSIYVISQGALDGIMEFNKYGVFLRYFGAPDVQLSFSDMISLAWRKIYRSISGEDADAAFITFVPTEFENLVVDEEGFVYSVVMATSETNKDQLMKMNFLGNNILDPNAKSTAKISTALSETYGDLERRGTTSQGNLFNDVAVDDDGFITMLDYNLSKIFEYDPDGNMTFVYSAPGYQFGQLRKKGAMGLAKLGKKTLVLDQYHGAVTVFDLTKYGRTLHDAINYYDQGKYNEAEDLWVEVLKANANCELAHIGIGKVLYQKGDYESALNHYKLANDRTNYQDAYSLYRESLLADNFDFIMTLLLVLVLLLVFAKIFGKRIFEAIKNKREGGADDDEIE